MTSVVILGAGVMGSAMCLPFADRGFDIRLVGTHLDEHAITSVQESGLHPKLNVILPANITCFQHDKLTEAVGDGTDLILLGVASAGVTWAVERLASVLQKPVPILMITKGMTAQMGTLPDLVAHSLSHNLNSAVSVAAIAGPCIAGELAVRRPTGTVIVSRDLSLAQRLCNLLQTDYYQPRISQDMMGAETCAAFKNFFAIAVGWAGGAQQNLSPTKNNSQNNNAAAILFNQAVRELTVLVTALGGSADSVLGMPGVGDLYVTCQAGRNSRLGHHLGQGLRYQDVKSGPMQHDTIEGAELGIAVAEHLREIVRAGKIDGNKLPLTLALLNTLTHNEPFTPEWALYH